MRVPPAITFGDVSQANYRIRDRVHRTPCRESKKLSRLLDARVFVKDEFMHPTGSFKERGARNALLMMSPEQRKRGVIAASAGNHAQALAFHAVDLGIPVTVVMPRIAPLTKVQNCRDIGANVVLEGDHLMESREVAMQLSEQEGLAYVNGYDDPDVIAGAGTMGIEIAEDVPDVDAVVIPVGGAGLIAGSALALKTLKPTVQVLGAEPATVPSLSESLRAGHVVDVPAGRTLADGLLVNRVGSNAFDLCKELVGPVALVKERFIALAMLRLLELEKCVVEGGGATGLAAMLQWHEEDASERVLPDLRGKTVVLPLCGGNVDTVTISRVMDRGLAADGRLVRFKATVSDRPGGISAITKVLADAGVSIREIQHERAWVEHDISRVALDIAVETAGVDHNQQMFDMLEAEGYEFILEGFRTAVSTHKERIVVTPKHTAPPESDSDGGDG